MDKKVCGKCNLEYEGDLEKCPVCEDNLFEKVADLHVTAIVQDTELYPEVDKERKDKETDIETEIKIER